MKAFFKVLLIVWDFFYYENWKLKSTVLRQLKSIHTFDDRVEKEWASDWKTSLGFNTYNMKNGHTTPKHYLTNGLYWADSQVYVEVAALKRIGHQRKLCALMKRSGYSSCTKGRSVKPLFY